MRKIEISYDGPIPAPVNRGATVGKLVVSGQGVPQAEMPLLAGEDVARLGVGGRAVKVLAHFVTGA